MSKSLNSQNFSVNFTYDLRSGRDSQYFQGFFHLIKSSLGYSICKQHYFLLPSLSCILLTALLTTRHALRHFPVYCLLSASPTRRSSPQYRALRLLPHPTANSSTWHRLGPWWLLYLFADRLSNSCPNLLSYTWDYLRLGGVNWLAQGHQAREGKLTLGPGLLTPSHPSKVDAIMPLPALHSSPLPKKWQPSLPFYRSNFASLF